MAFQSDSYIGLMHAMMFLSKALEGRPVPQDRPWRRDIDGFTNKIFAHAASIATLINGEGDGRGTYLPAAFQEEMGIEVRFFDFSSMAILVRATLETHLAFHFLMVQPTDREQEHFRRLAWEISGFRYSLRYDFYSETGLDARLGREAHLEKLRIDLQACPHYQQLTPDQQRLARRGEWRAELQDQSYTELAVLAGFDRTWFEGLYAHLSSHAHSGEHAIGQLMEANTAQAQRQLLESMSGCLLVALGHFIKAFQSVIPEAMLPGHLQHIVDLKAYLGTPENSGQELDMDPGSIRFKIGHGGRLGALLSLCVRLGLRLHPAGGDAVEGELRQQHTRNVVPTSRRVPRPGTRIANPV